MYTPPDAVRGMPHLVLDRVGDALVVKPFDVVRRDRRGAYHVPSSACKAVRLVQVVQRAALSPNREQVKMLGVAVDDCLREKELKLDGRAALLNARAELEAYALGKWKAKLNEL